MRSILGRESLNVNPSFVEIHLVLTQQPINQGMDTCENIIFLAAVIKRHTEEDVQNANIQYHIVTTSY